MTASRRVMYPLALMLLPLGGCLDWLTPESGRDEICGRVEDAARRMPDVVTTDDRHEALARVIPGGYGGRYDVVGTATRVIFLKSPTRMDDAREVAIEAASCARADDIAMFGTIIDADSVVEGEYDFVELALWRRQLVTGVSNSPHIDLAAHDIDEARNTLAFAVYDAPSRDALIDLAAGLGVPAGALAVEVW